MDAVEVVMAWLKSIKEFLLGREETTALARVEPTLPPEPYRAPPVEEHHKLIVLDLFYNIQGGEGVDPAKLQEFTAKSRRRAIRYFSRKEIRHRITATSADAIEFEFNRPHEPQVVPGKPVRIRWTNKAAHTQ